MGNKVTKPGTPIDSTDDLVDEFKTVYKEKGPSDLQSQIPYLEKMADHYQAKNDWPSLLRVSVSCYLYHKGLELRSQTSCRNVSWSDTVLQCHYSLH